MEQDGLHLAKAQTIVRHEILCYNNCVFVLMQNFRFAQERATSADEQFLMVGRWWNIEITERCEFGDADWQGRS